MAIMDRELELEERQQEKRSKDEKIQRLHTILRHDVFFLI
jgi:hypothetical protein